MQALHADDEGRIVLALKLSRTARDSHIAEAVRGCLRHPSPAVRTAAVESMEAMPLSDPEGVIASLLGESHEALRRAAIGYLLARSPEPRPSPGAFSTARTRRSGSTWSTRCSIDPSTPLA